MITRVAVVARRSERLRAAARASREAARRVRGAAAAVSYLRGRSSFSELPDAVAVRVAYNVLLGREPDGHGPETFARWLSNWMGRNEMVATIVGSDEFAQTALRAFGPSLHLSRGAFVRSLPAAGRMAYVCVPDG